LGIPTENTAKWLHESRGPGAAHRAATLTELHDRRTQALVAGDIAEVRRVGGTITTLTATQQTWHLRARQLLIVDEATLAGTLDLSLLVTQAQQAGAKVLLVGDHAQLGSVSAGGGFGMLARTGAPTHLHSLWRFTHPWEAQATRGLRAGDPTIIEDYLDHGRLHSGTPEAMLEKAYQNWATDRAAGRTSILVAADTATVTELNTRAHDDAITAGAVTGPLVTLGEPCAPNRGQVGAGDTVVTRRNDRSLHTGDGSHVRNGALWTVTATHPDGALTVQPTNRDGVGVRLPATYVAEHVDLGYATTAHRAQGITVDTSHALGDPATSREAFYVAMTRGRHANHAYLAESAVTEDCHPSRATGTLTADTKVILGVILANSQAELSATETLALTTTQQLFPGQQDEHDVDQMMTRPDHAAALDGPWGPVAPNTRDDQSLWDPTARSARARTHEPAGRFIA
jgi:ATP-dependent exoDNAse (exonuclease V) alpha subunit